jgi:crotonobetainyl-CoA:carnitine CoA-transferase CaiB-like acyl-CoA transferase
VHSREEFIDGAQVAALNLRAEIADPEAGATVQMGTLATLHGTPGPAPRPLAFDDRPVWRPRPAEALSSGLRPPDSAGPLAGLRVLDLSGFIAGSYGPMTLADFGADVIKLESPEGDAFRSFGFGFLGWNRGKRALSVDSRRPEGRAVQTSWWRTSGRAAPSGWAWTTRRSPASTRA